MTLDQGSEAQARATAPRTPTDTTRRAWWVVAMLVLFIVVNYADKVVVGIAGVDMIRDLGIDSTRYGVVQSSFFWFFAVGSLAGGLLIGRIKARWLLAGTAGLWVLSMLPAVWSSSFAVIVACRMLLGFAEGPASAMAMSVTHSWFRPEKRALPTSFVTAGASVGPLLSAPLLTEVIISHSWHAAFAVLAVAGVLWTAVWLFVGREGPESGAAATHPTTVPLPDRVPLRRLFGTRTVIGVHILFFAAYCSASVKISWMPLYLREGLGYDARTAGQLVTLPYAATALFIILSGFVSRALTERGVPNRITRGLIPCALMGAGGLCTLGLGMAGRGPLLIVLIVCGASLTTGGMGLAYATVSDVAPAGQRGLVMSCVVAAFSVGGMVAPLVLGNLIDSAATPLDGYSTGFLLIGAVLVIGSLSAGCLINQDRDARLLGAWAKNEITT
ncbi:MFS transporter [Streptomyces sp. NPDC102451]|uniref:MFS transporter n=1 Tax=Streptomyces sp. NPDC102451 TaxID=3366177 RepID=UPI00381DA3D0